VGEKGKRTVSWRKSGRIGEKTVMLGKELNRGEEKQQ